MPRPERARAVFPAATVLMALAGCAEGTVGAPRFETVTVERRDISVTVEATGTIEPVATVEVKSKASGEVLEVGAGIGDEVEAGQLLVRIDPRTPRNLVAQADAEVAAAGARQRTAEAQLARGRRLREEGYLNEAELEALELEVANTRAAAVSARVALENARIGLEDTEVRATAAGTVLTRLVERGQVISSPTRDVGGGTLLLTMADLERVRARVRVDETDIGKLRAGVPAGIRVAAFPGRGFEGAVEKIEPQAVVDQNVTLFSVLIVIDNDEGLLRPGMNVDAVFDVASREGVLALPVMALRSPRDVESTAGLLDLDVDAIRRSLGDAAPARAPRGAAEAALGLGRGLWVVAVRDGEPRPVAVQTGVTDLDRVEITAGLAEGDEVLMLPTASVVELQHQIQDIASRRGGIPGLTRQPAQGEPQAPARSR